MDKSVPYEHILTNSNFPIQAKRFAAFSEPLKKGLIFCEILVPHS